MRNANGIVDELRQVCHDIRQPIAGVLALAGAALAEAGLSESARDCLEQIADLAEWQSKLIDHWFCETTPDPPHSRHADVVRVVNEAIAAERAVWPGELIFLWPVERAFSPVHPVALRRVVANLLANATRAAGPAGMVTIEVGCRGGRMLVTIEDSGPGFGQLAAGSGLGLVAAARLAARHGGKLACGRGVDGGGRVSLRLPVASAGPGERAADATCSG